MGFLDIILFPAYVYLFYILFRSRRKKYNDPVLSYYHNIGFWLKVFGALVFTIFNVYVWKGGDSRGLYYTEGANIYRLILKDFSNFKWLVLPGPSFDQSLLKDPSNLGYFRIENNFMVARITAIFSFFTLGRYLLINLCFSMFAFSGLWRLYRFFYKLYPHLHKKIGIAILFLPTVVFWSSGILKDSLCIGALGWLSFSLYQTFYERQYLALNTFILLISGYVLWILKAYILVSYVPFFFFFLFLKNVSLIKSGVTRAFIFLAILVVSAGLFSQIKAKLIEALGDYATGGLTSNIQAKTSAYSIREAGSSFSLGVNLEEGVTLGKLALIAPAAIVATLYRPFLWESANVSTLLSSFESLFIMMLTLVVIFKAGPISFFQTVLKDPVILYCILFALLFAIFVGATTRNFGSLVRYKIPCMPFYVIAIFLVQEATRVKKESLLKNKQAEL
jgi:hypothetical protein